MSTLRSLVPVTPFVSLVDRARSWPVDSQQVARRNAMVACTALAARRAEREDVDDFFATGVRVPDSHADAAHG